MAATVGKLILVSSAAIGSAYTGAVIYGRNHEGFRDKMENMAPGWQRPFEMARKPIDSLIGSGPVHEAEKLGPPKIEQRPQGKIESLDKVPRKTIDGQKRQELQRAENEKDTLLSALLHAHEEFATKMRAEKAELQARFESLLAEEKGKISPLMLSMIELQRHDYEKELARQKDTIEREWLERVDILVDEERGRRLARQAELEERINLVEQTEKVVKGHLMTAKIFQDLSSIIASGWQHLRKSNQALSIDAHLAVIREIAIGLNDDFLQAIAQTSSDSSQALLSFEELGRSFANLKPLMRQYSMLSGNGAPTLLPYFATSWVASVAMRDPTGLLRLNRADSVISCAEKCLDVGDLAGALKSLNRLCGWSRVIAKPWMIETRRRLEAAQRLEALEAYLNATRLVYPAV